MLSTPRSDQPALERTFRIPSAAVRQEYVQFGVLSAVVFSVLAFMGRLPLFAAILSVGIVAAVLLLVYPLFSRRIWVTVSANGVQGRTFIGRRRRFLPWAEPVVARHHSAPKGPSGVALFRLRTPGRPRLLHSCFIPDAILRSQEFQAALALCAPAHHPLLQWVSLRGGASKS